MNIEDFKPTPVGKYSPLLYAYLKKLAKKYGAECIRVFQTGSFEDRAVHRPRLIINEILIAHYGDPEDGAGGRSLRSIVCGDRGSNAQSFFYTRGFNLRDITDQFFDDYKRIGRCVWDERHIICMIDDEDRFTFRGKTRTCNWCGAKHRQHVKIVQKEVVTWRPVRARKAA